VHWKLFSLEEVNKKEGAEVDWEKGRSAPVERVMALVRRRHGQDGFDRFYDALGKARFVREETINEPSVIEAALKEAGLDPGLRAEALADPSTRDEVAAEHAEVVAKQGAFGVPTLVLREDQKSGIFGPVIDAVPQGEEAGELWDHVKVLARQQSFYELKRSRPTPPHH
jgi:2-hydroxychromene-2-carboxylate isomerase